LGWDQKQRQYEQAPEFHGSLEAIA